MQHAGGPERHRYKSLVTPMVSVICWICLFVFSFFCSYEEAGNKKTLGCVEVPDNGLFTWNFSLMKASNSPRILWGTFINPCALHISQPDCDSSTAFHSLGIVIDESRRPGFKGAALHYSITVAIALVVGRLPHGRGFQMLISSGAVSQHTFCVGDVMGERSRWCRINFTQEGSMNGVTHASSSSRFIWEQL